jgi:hypothetical protein
VCNRKSLSNPCLSIHSFQNAPASPHCSIRPVGRRCGRGIWETSWCWFMYKLAIYIFTHSVLNLQPQNGFSDSPCDRECEVSLYLRVLKDDRIQARNCSMRRQARRRLQLRVAFMLIEQTDGVSEHGAEGNGRTSQRHWRRLHSEELRCLYRLQNIRAMT